MIFSGAYLLVRCLLSYLTVLARHEVSKDAELLILRHEHEVLRGEAGSATARATGCGSQHCPS